MDGGVVLVNPSSGPDQTDLEDLRGLFPSSEVEECRPDELGERARRAADQGAGYVGVSGGDGTIHTVAQELGDGAVPLLVIPTGTRNHFARQLGIPNLEAAAAAAASGRVERVDLGEVSGHRFVNNASLGTYPHLVIRRRLHSLRLPKSLANLAAAWDQLRRGQQFNVRVDGDHRRAWAVFVGNGRYGNGLLDLTERASLVDGVLDVRIVRADRRLARLRVALAVLFGMLARSPLVERHEAATVTIDRMRVDEMAVALDGEVKRLPVPLEFRCCPRSLPVLVP
jgi:undecaprenyl-diphosphatase